MNNFQRVDSKSNSQVGRNFEAMAKEYFLEKEGFNLQPAFLVDVGVAEVKKKRRIDLGSVEPEIIVECKSHRRTITGNMPSAKIAIWNESMLYFHIAPKHFRKVLFVLKKFHTKRNESSAAFYARNYSHLIPVDVEIIEHDEKSKSAVVINPTV